eukprot:645190-Pelagomonas_calceolata.AAC.1
MSHVQQEQHDSCAACYHVKSTAKTYSTRPLIYVYDLPPRLNAWPYVGNLDRPQYLLFWHRLLGSGAQTPDPDKADCGDACGILEPSVSKVEDASELKVAHGTERFHALNTVGMHKGLESSLPWAALAAVQGWTKLARAKVEQQEAQAAAPSQLFHKRLSV